MVARDKDVGLPDGKVEVLIRRRRGRLEDTHCTKISVYNTLGLLLVQIGQPDSNLFHLQENVKQEAGGIERSNHTKAKRSI